MAKASDLSSADRAQRLYAKVFLCFIPEPHLQLNDWLVNLHFHVQDLCACA